jgi:hypothetical protein
LQTDWHALHRYPGEQTNSTSSISFLIVNYVPKIYVGLVGFVSLGTAARAQLDRFNQRQETLDLPYLTLLCDNLKNSMFLQNFTAETSVFDLEVLFYSP